MLSKCSGLLGIGSHWSSGWGRPRPRPPSMPVNAEVPLRCMPTTRIHGPSGNSEAEPDSLAPVGGSDTSEMETPLRSDPRSRVHRWGANPHDGCGSRYLSPVYLRRSVGPGVPATGGRHGT